MPSEEKITIDEHGEYYLWLRSALDIIHISRNAEIWGVAERCNIGCGDSQSALAIANGLMGDLEKVRREKTCQHDIRNMSSLLD